MKHLLVALCAVLAAPSAMAQGTFPSRPISVVVGFAPGGGTDIVARIVAKGMSEQLGQPVTVENRAGAGGNIAADYVAKANPDGHTILLGTVGALTVAPHLNPKLPYQPLKDFAPISMAVVFPNVLVVNTSQPFRTLADWVRLAKDKPGTVTHGSSGIGGAGHLAGELLRMRANIDTIHVAYKGGGPAMLAVLSNEINGYFGTPASVNTQIKAGQVRALVTTGAKRDALLPDVPTIAESGYPGYEATNWYAYVAPAKTPKEVVDRLHLAITRALRSPEVVSQLQSQALEPSPGTPAELASYMQREYETWGRVVKQAGIKAE